ncbi:extracellular solute-binding protein [Streptomyces sp. NPDC051940]|uniref:extracellular solute-binding protein n=1 Tax=Streptomyces sp. NPDC051940 TaxID=3155675 RepID=UPI003421A9E0
MGMSLSGCGLGSGEGDEDVVLKVIAADYGKPGTKTSSKRYWDDVSEEFENNHPGIRVDVKVIAWKYVDAEVKKLVDAGTPPDLAQIGAYADYASQGLLYSADDVLSIPTQANFIPSIAEAGEVSRIPYGLPFVSSSRLLFFNKKLFREAGLETEKGPQSWSDILNAAKKLKANGVKTPFGLPLGSEEAQAESLLWMLGNGGGYTDSTGSYSLNSGENVETFEWIQKNLTGEGLATTNAKSTDRQEVFDGFLKNDVGMFFGHPTLIKDTEAEGIEVGIADRLPGRTGPAQSTMGVVDWMMAFKANGNREPIGQFLDFVFSDKQVTDFAQRYDLLPTTVTGASRLRAERPELTRFITQLESAVFYPAEKTSWAAVSAMVKQRIGKAAMPGGNAQGILDDLQDLADKAERQEEEE